MDIRNLLILSMVKNIGPTFIKKNRIRLSQEYSCEPLVNEFRPEELYNLDQYAKAAEEIITDCKDHEIQIISILDEAYPSQLLEISDPPSLLFLKGNKSLLNRVIAIIGTRRSTELGNQIAERVGVYFSKQFSICNGLVEGIDEHAIYHNGKVSPNVVGIISGGLFYKETCTAHHVRVIEDVLNAGGLVISEFYPHQKEDRFSGSKASRIQAGLSDGLILVQSKVDGGSKYTLAKFAKLGRPIGVIHYPSSEEYNSDSFSANRLIVEKGKDGIAEMVGMKKASSVSVSGIVPLSSKADYETLISLINKRDNNTLF